MITKATFVGEGFVRKPPKFERFVRPTGMRFKKAHVTHPELQATFHLKIIGVKKNPQSNLYTGAGLLYLVVAVAKACASRGDFVEMSCCCGGQDKWVAHADLND